MDERVKVERSESERVAVVVSGLITQRDSGDGGGDGMEERRRRQPDEVVNNKTLSLQPARRAAVGGARTKPHTCQTCGDGQRACRAY